MLGPEEFIKDAIQKIKEQIGDEKAIIALSGGVDSSVCSVLVQEAIGDNLIAIFVDHGLLREGEVEEVTNTFKDRLNFNYVDASEEFLNALEGVEDPEEKRKIIGKVFIDVFEREAEKMLKNEEKQIPTNIDYDKIPNLASEARQKLKEVRPLNIAQAIRISGVNPADISILLVYLRKQYKE